LGDGSNNLKKIDFHSNLNHFFIRVALKMGNV